MTEKPEWFQLVDSDEQISDFVKPRRAGKRIPATAVLASLAIIVGGAFFANANGETSANAETVSVASSTASNPTTAPSTTSDSTQKGIHNPTTKNGDAPAIGQLPQGGGRDGEDDDFGDDGDRSRFDGNHDGDREHHRGPVPASATSTED